MISLSMWNAKAVNLIEVRVKCGLADMMQYSGEERQGILISYSWRASRISGMLPQRSVPTDNNKHLGDFSMFHLKEMIGV